MVIRGGGGGLCFPPFPSTNTFRLVLFESGTAILLCGWIS